MTPLEKIAPANPMVKIHAGLTHQQVDTYGLVLSSTGVIYQSKRTTTGWELRVPEKDTAKATAAVAAYLTENEDSGDLSTVPTWPVTRTLAGIWMAVILIAAHGVIVVSGQVNTIRRLYGASADQILNGELYRITTALLLHANGVHLAGNVVGLALFGTAVGSTAGFGVGGLMVLVSGMAGNLFNALLFQTGHHSIGASTAVFGAVGITAAHQFVTHWQTLGGRLKAWVPIGGGLALLGLMGSSTNTDLTAHFFGFVAGFFIGLVFSATRKKPPGTSTQYGSLLLAVVLVAASFLVG